MCCLTHRAVHRLVTGPERSSCFHHHIECLNAHRPGLGSTRNRLTPGNSCSAMFARSKLPGSTRLAALKMVRSLVVAIVAMEDAELAVAQPDATHAQNEVIAFERAAFAGDQAQCNNLLLLLYRRRLARLVGRQVASSGSGIDLFGCFPGWLVAKRRSHPAHPETGSSSGLGRVRGGL